MILYASIYGILVKSLTIKFNPLTSMRKCKNSTNSTTRKTNLVSDLTGGSQVVTKSLSDFSRIFKEVFSTKINSKFGFLIRKWMEKVFEVWSLNYFRPKYPPKTAVFIRFWAKNGTFSFESRIEIFSPTFVSLYGKWAEFWVPLLTVLLFWYRCYKNYQFGRSDFF